MQPDQNTYNKENTLIPGKIINAFLSVDRDHFLKNTGARYLHKDGSIVTKLDSRGVPVSSSTSPSIMMSMIRELNIEEGNSILELGTGTGYNAAILAKLAGANGHVTTIEYDFRIYQEVTHTIKSLGLKNVSVIFGDILIGELELSRYDRIIGTFDMPLIPGTILHALKNSSYMVFPSCFLYAFQNKNGSFQGYPFSAASFMSSITDLPHHSWLKLANKQTASPLFVYTCKHEQKEEIRKILNYQFTIDNLSDFFSPMQIHAFAHFLWINNRSRFFKVQSLKINNAKIVYGFGIMDLEKKRTIIIILEEKNIAEIGKVKIAYYGEGAVDMFTKMMDLWNKEKKYNLTEQKVNLKPFNSNYLQIC